MLRAIIKELLEGGEVSLKDLIGRAESFELEFKTKEHPNNYLVSKIDKRNLGKALSGFSNAEGGVVIFGIATKQTDHQDTATELQPIANIERFKSEVDGRLGELLLPANPSISTYAVLCANDRDRGYLLIDIGRSELRPHMSMAPDHQRYYRRFAGGTLIMDHGLVRDTMMAPKEAHIEPIWRMACRSTTGLNLRIITGKLDLYLANVGRKMATMPYARIWMNPSLHSTSVGPAAPMDGRSDGSVAYYGTRDCVIHPLDEIHFGSFRIVMEIQFESFKRALDSGDLADAVAPEIWKFGRTYDRSQSSFKQEFERLKIRTSIGAENAQSREQHFDLTKIQLIKLALNNNLLRVEQAKANALTIALEALEAGCSID